MAIAYNPETYRANAARIKASPKLLYLHRRWSFCHRRAGRAIRKNDHRWWRIWMSHGHLYSDKLDRKLQSIEWPIDLDKVQ